MNELKLDWGGAIKYLINSIAIKYLIYSIAETTWPLAYKKGFSFAL